MASQGSAGNLRFRSSASSSASPRLTKGESSSEEDQEIEVPTRDTILLPPPSSARQDLQVFQYKLQERRGAEKLTLSSLVLALWQLVVYLIQGYITVLLFFPRIIWQLNLDWNPLVTVPRYAIRQVKGDFGSRMSPNDDNDARNNVVASENISGKDGHQSLVVKGPPSGPIGSLATGVPRSLGPPSAYGQGFRWLEPGEKHGKRIVLASYPRSGNSLMRSLLEQITGIYTGGDTRPERSLSKALKDMGLQGEGVVDDSVWFVKSHFPERHGWKSFRAHKCILVIRNPFDAMDSYFNMILTRSHNKSLHPSQYERFADVWDRLVKNEIEVWKRFHKFWLSQEIPVMIVRYEDLLVHRQEMMRRVLSFVLDVPTLEGTMWESRIAEVCKESNETRPYKPRSGKIGGSFSHYNPEQLQYVLQSATPQLTGFGYHPETQGFPTRIEVPKKNIKPGNADAELLVNKGKLVRQDDDPFGRLFTRFRKSLLEPVLDIEGQPLNVEEVLAARELATQKEASLLEGSTES